jgi:hypothetical protein
MTKELNKENLIHEERKRRESNMDRYMIIRRRTSRGLTIEEKGHVHDYLKSSKYDGGIVDWLAAGVISISVALFQILVFRLSNLIREWVL